MISDQYKTSSTSGIPASSFLIRPIYCQICDPLDRHLLQARAISFLSNHKPQVINPVLLVVSTKWKQHWKHKIWSVACLTNWSLTHCSLLPKKKVESVFMPIARWPQNLKFYKLSNLVAVKQEYYVAAFPLAQFLHCTAYASASLA